MTHELLLEVMRAFINNATERHPEQPCLRCGRRLENMTPLKNVTLQPPDEQTTPAEPAELLIAICSVCGHAMTYTTGRRLRALTPEEQILMQTDPELRAAIEATRTMVAMKNRRQARNN
jgi:hypothetical protein